MDLKYRIKRQTKLGVTKFIPQVRILWIYWDFRSGNVYNTGYQAELAIDKRQKKENETIYYKYNPK